MTASFVSAGSTEPRPVFSDPLSEMTRRVERGRARLHGDKSPAGI